MRNNNKRLASYQYTGNRDLGGRNQNGLKYFKPFYASKNLQPSGSIPALGGFVGGIGVNVSSYSPEASLQRFKNVSVANMVGHSGVVPSSRN